MKNNKTFLSHNPSEGCNFELQSFTRIPYCVTFGGGLKCVSVQTLWLLMSDFKVPLLSLTVRHLTAMSKSSCDILLFAKYSPVGE